MELKKEVMGFEEKDVDGIVDCTLFCGRIIMLEVWL
jgi:hypothetical protein